MECLEKCTFSIWTPGKLFPDYFLLPLPLLYDAQTHHNCAVARMTL